MPTNETVIEIVRFTDKGISEISARTKAFAGEVDDLAKKQKTLLGLLADPRYDQHQKRIEGMRKQYELMSLRARNVAAAQGLADGSSAKHLRNVTALNKQYADVQRRVELTARYGERLGGFMAKYGRAVSIAGGAIGLGVGAVAGAGLGLARQGFQGTVEQARFDSEMKQLARELAAVMKPVMELMTKGARAIRQQLEKLDHGGQNLVMGGLLLGGTAGGALALRSVARMFGMGAAGAAGGGAGAAGAAGAGGGFFGLGRRGLLRAGAGAGGLGLLAYGATTDNPLATIAGGAMAGWSVGGPIGALAGGTAATVASAPDRRAGERPFDYYRRMRESGRSKVGATLATAGESISALFGGSTEEESKAKADAARRKVQLAGGGFEATGSGYERIAAAVEKVEGERDTRDLTAAVRELTEEMRRRDRPGPPRPGGDR